MRDILLYLLSCSCYLALALQCAHARRIPAVSFALLATALASHGTVLALAMQGADGLSFGVSIVLSLTLWLAMLVYGVEHFFTPLHPLLRLAAPVAALCCVLPAILPGAPRPLPHGGWMVSTHIVVAILAYALFTLAVFHALLIALAERALHGAQPLAESEHPPLLLLERLLFRLVGAAFFFLTLTVGSGLLFAERLFGQPVEWSHRTLFGIAAWALFAILLLGRHLRGWRGRAATHWLLAGFILLLVTYAGTRFALEMLPGTLQ